MKNHIGIVLVMGMVSLSAILSATEQWSPNEDAAFQRTQALDSGQIPLKNLTEVHVSFTGASWATVKGKIWPDIELRLRLAGIKVVSDFEYKYASQKGVDYPFIILNTDCTPTYFLQDKQTNVVLMSLELHDTVLLQRDPNLSFSVPVWSDSTICLFKEEYRFEKQSETALRLFTNFLNDYLAANPKKDNTRTDQQETK